MFLSRRVGTIWVLNRHTQRMTRDHGCFDRFSDRKSGRKDGRNEGRYQAAGPAATSRIIITISDSVMNGEAT